MRRIWYMKNISHSSASDMACPPYGDTKFRFGWFVSSARGAGRFSRQCSTPTRCDGNGFLSDQVHEWYPRTWQEANDANRSTRIRGLNLFSQLIVPLSAVFSRSG